MKIINCLEVDSNPRSLDLEAKAQLTELPVLVCVIAFE